VELSLPDMPFGMSGEVTFGELVDDLAKSYAAPRDGTIADVGTLCAAWPTKGFWNCDTSHRGPRDPPACGLLRFRNA
jgi:hypothetical protein